MNIYKIAYSKDQISEIAYRKEPNLEDGLP